MPWSQIRHWLGWLLALEVAVFAAAAIYLAAFYEPTAADAWTDVYALRDDVTLGLRARTIRAWSAALAIVTAVAWVSTLMAERRGRNNDPPPTPGGQIPSTGHHLDAT